MSEVKNTFRLWPHRLEGEGHYVAVLQKNSGSVESAREGDRESKRKGMEILPTVDRNVRKLYEEFAQENLRCLPEGELILFGEQLYLLPCTLPLKGLKVLRPGLHLGTLKKNRFEPGHALALALRPEEARVCCNLSMEQAAIYLRGETLEAEGEKGWKLVLAEGYSLGWGKAAGGTLKNHYPKGLRKIVQ